ncbi:MAG: IS200/IS605 family transposase [Gemmatimonadetes bacterium]|nr:IS200/IS605 family transposase [Gemmatimonadota bacterium]
MRHPHARLYVHLVWATWDRAPLITPEIRERIYPVMQHQASRLGAQIMAIGGVEDHVHVLARLPTTLSVAELVGRMKGASSHMVTQIIGRAFKWQGAYGAYTLGRSGLIPAREYVLNQERHHRNGSTYAALEKTTDK